LALPAAEQGLDPIAWARAFALFNPHALVQNRWDADAAEHGNSDPSTLSDLHQPVVQFPGEWRKFLPTDLTSPHWYNGEALRRLVFAEIGRAKLTGRDRPLREFVMDFRGTSRSAQAKAVCDWVPTIGRLSDFETDEDAIDRLLVGLQDTARAPSPGVLGLVGDAAFYARFQQWYGVHRWWYRKAEGDIDGIPFIFEVAVAETERPGHFYHAVNFSPTFTDPLSGTTLFMGELYANSTTDFLRRAHALPEREQQPYKAVAVHLVCPTLEWLDRGKTRLRVPGRMTATLADTLWRATKELYREEERRRRDAAREWRQAEARERTQEPRWLSLKDAVFQLLPAAAAHATGNGAVPANVRNLYYAIREPQRKLTGRELEYGYFSQTLLPLYRQEHGALRGIYYDPRGILYEPHSGHQTPLGTREVDAYRFPAWLYNKILYIEKKGLWPTLQAAEIAERYDMAVIAAEGYASEAARVLFANADRRERYQLFVLHDADAHGYNIARTLQEETARMPGYHVDVIDLGLQLADGLARGLQVEEFTRKKALPSGLTLTDLEREYFMGRPATEKSWIARRIELNAFTAPALVAFIEEQLEQVGVTGKVIPPSEVLAQEFEQEFTTAVSNQVDEVVTELLSLDAVKRAVADTLHPYVLRNRPQPQPLIARALQRRQAWPWRKVVENRVHARLRRQDERLREQVREALREALDNWDADAS